MELGLHIADFTWNGGAAELGPRLARHAKSAEDAGITRITVMDHFWQIRGVGPAEHEMLEAYTALGFLAAHTTAVKLHTLVTGVTYREPGLLAKAVTTLDVLSGGRAMLGIGAAWNEEESRGLGLLFPPTAERFERLEEALQVCLQMWSGKAEPYDGQHYHLERTLNVPQVLSRPHPPILIGGGGERKTLRLVAQYADSCNLFANADLPRKLEVLRQHCADVGRDYDEIEKTVLYNFDLGPDGEHVDETLQQLRELADLGFSVAHGRVADVHDPKHLELIGERIVPVVADW
jgi:F420-dependent oxidoreductase-like protein